MNSTVQISLKIRAHDSVHGARQETENHPVRMVNSAPWQIKATAEGKLLKRVLDRCNHFVERKNLTDGDVLQKEHMGTQGNRAQDDFDDQESCSVLLYRS